MGSRDDWKPNAEEGDKSRSISTNRQEIVFSIEGYLQTSEVAPWTARGLGVSVRQSRKEIEGGVAWLPLDL